MVYRAEDLRAGIIIGQWGGAFARSDCLNCRFLLHIPTSNVESGVLCFSNSVLIYSNKLSNGYYSFRNISAIGKAEYPNIKFGLGMDCVVFDLMDTYHL